jgi:NADH-quinone oxidoreductase subunit F
MVDQLTPVLTRRWQSPRSWSIDTYEQLEGYQALRHALTAHPDQLIQLVKDSGLRGRGGAGFPTGLKWGFIPQGPTGPGAKPKYLVVNADEGEPGTCKDIPTMMADPHSLIEGCIITCYAIRANFCAIYVRGEALHCIRRLRRAVEEAHARGYLGTDILGSGFDLDIVVHAGAGAYICGEETALLDSLEGRRGQPRLKPPFPATSGLYASPTVVNNVETIASVPAIVQGGSDWFRSMGTEKSPGPKIYSVSGHVERPGQYEAPLGITLRQLLDLAARRLVHPDLHGGAPGRPARLRGRRRGGLDAGYHGRAGLQRDRLGAVGRDEVDRVLQARVVRQVHPVPRGHLLAGADPRTDGARRGHRGRRRDDAGHLRQHPRPLVLRPR